MMIIARKNIPKSPKKSKKRKKNENCAFLFPKKIFPSNKKM